MQQVDAAVAPVRLLRCLSDHKYGCGNSHWKKDIPTGVCLLLAHRWISYLLSRLSLRASLEPLLASTLGVFEPYDYAFL